MSDPFLDDMGEYEQAIHRADTTGLEPIMDMPMSPSEPAPTFGVFAVDTSVRRNVETGERVVVMNLLTHEGAVHCLLLTPAEAHETGKELFVAGWEADDNHEAAEAFLAAFEADPNAEYDGDGNG